LHSCVALCRGCLFARRGTDTSLSFFDDSDVIWKALTGGPYLTVEEAEHVVHSLSPWASGTMFYAALTGVILWFSSVVGGWIDNWAVYRQLPQSLAEHPIGEWLGMAGFDGSWTCFRTTWPPGEAVWPSDS